MRNKKYLASILFFLASFNAFSSSQIKCDDMPLKGLLNGVSAISIDVDIYDYNGWAKNYLRIIETDGNYISKRQKKKFKADLKVVFKDGRNCKFPAKIRVHGDMKDHISNIPMVASLDVALLEGNVDGVTKFKLFLPVTRNEDNEIFITSLLKSIGYLAPKTYRIQSSVNGSNVQYIFQEKITKEFLEFNNLREAPILEGDERFFYNNNRGFLTFGLARVVNRKWARRGLTSTAISTKALSLLNKAYLNYLRNYKSGEANTLQAKYLAIDKEHIARNQAYQAIMVAIGGSHGLGTNNRKFYYDPIYRYFEPIYYDGNVTFLDDPHGYLSRVNNKINPDEIRGSLDALTLIKNIDFDKFVKNLQVSGAKVDIESVKKYLDILKRNLKEISKNKIHSNLSKEPYSPFFKGSNASLRVLGISKKHYEKNNKKQKLAFSRGDRLELDVCNLSMKRCSQIDVNLNQYSKMLSGQFKMEEGVEYVFIGDKEDYLENKKNINFEYNEKNKSIILEKDTKLILIGDITVEIDSINKILSLTQETERGRALIINGSLDQWRVQFKGIDQVSKKSTQRFDKNLLTGCLTFLDITLQNIDINFKNSSCEDAVNFVRVEGVVNNINVENANSDAIDADFSNIIFKKIKVQNSGNDCLDFSAGKYLIENAELLMCDDKAVSIGEASSVEIGEISIIGANIAIASKDSSIGVIRRAKIDKVNTCLAVYNKKQEFWAGKLRTEEFNCSPNL